MPWKEESVMSQRLKLIEQLLLPGVSVNDVCVRSSISRKTAYKWLNRYYEGGIQALDNRSRKPHNQPHRTCSKLESLVITTHQKYPYWGPKMLRDHLLYIEKVSVVPSHTTIGRILLRNDCRIINNQKSNSAKIRFEREAANDLWQIDFKGSFMTDSYRCYPLTILDDYSRYSIGLRACKNEQAITVKEQLTMIFKEYGLPEQINVDNGNPWGSADLNSKTSLQIWLFKLGIRVSHSSPYHPQTNGKDERFHRTLKLEVLHNRRYKGEHDIQSAFNQWQHIYNYKRPHRALDGRPPCSRYKISDKRYPSRLAQPEYGSEDVVRKVHGNTGIIRFKGKRYHAGKALSGEYVAIKETDATDKFAIFFMDQFIKTIKLGQGI